MKITAIKQQVKNTERASIYLDGKYAFSLSLNQLVAEKLRVGLELSDERLKELESTSQNDKLRYKVMNWAFLRPRSVRELEQYLRRLKVENTQWLIDECIGRGWINDRTFAEWWVGRSSRKSKSITALRSELSQKGIDREIVSEVLADSSDDTALYELVAVLRTKTKYKQDEQKLMRYLASKGFRYSSIVEALGMVAGDNLD